MMCWFPSQKKCLLAGGIIFQTPVAAFTADALIARFMGPTWGPSGADRTQAGPMLSPWTLLSGMLTAQFKTWVESGFVITCWIMAWYCMEHNCESKTRLNLNSPKAPYSWDMGCLLLPFPRKLTMSKQGWIVINMTLNPYSPIPLQNHLIFLYQCSKSATFLQ